MIDWFYVLYNFLLGLCLGAVVLVSDPKYCSLHQKLLSGAGPGAPVQ